MEGLTRITGAEIIASAIYNLNVKVVFGLVGIPVIEIADALQAKGIKFVAFRNEQAASYAASVYGYLTNSASILLVVGGPGIIHALAGIFNSQVNQWPMLVLAGSTPRPTVLKGGFQELDQLQAVQQYVKFEARPDNLNQIQDLIYQAFRKSQIGKQGVSYIDLPGDIITDSAPSGMLAASKRFQLSIPKFAPDFSRINKVATLLKYSKFPLIIIGKGAANTNNVPNFITKYQLPFLPSPMGKGIMHDTHELNMSAARSLVLEKTDLVIILGARLNWMFLFGKKFNSKKCTIIPVSHDPEEQGYNFTSDQISRDIGDGYSMLDIGLIGDIQLVVDQFLDCSVLQNYKYGIERVPDVVKSKISKNAEKLYALENIILRDPVNYKLNYYNVYKQIREFLFDERSKITKKRLIDQTYVVSEGANTMDISRQCIPMVFSKQRLDCGTNSTMGVGVGYAIAAKLASPSNYVLAIEGDSAFGFSAMELETAVRYSLQLIIVIMNNSGIYHGVNNSKDKSAEPEPIELSKNTRYDLMAESLGAKGYFVDDLQKLRAALESSFSDTNHSSVINVIIDPGDSNAKISFKWQDSEKLQEKSKL